MNFPKVKIVAPKLPKLARPAAPPDITQFASPTAAPMQSAAPSKTSQSALPTKPPRPKTPNYHRRPSVEIAQSFVELNLKAVIDAEKLDQLSPRERKKLARAEAKAAKKRHPVRNAILAVLTLAVLAVGSAAVWWQTSMQPVNRADRNSYQFEVATGATTDQVATALQKAKFVRNTLAFRIYARLHGNVIQAGTHMLSPSDTLPEIADKLTRGATSEIDVQVPPGLTLAELRAVFKKYDYTDADIDAALNAHYDNDILNDKPDGASLEGYIFPDTYRVYAGDKLNVVIEKALDQLSQVAAENDLRAKFAAHGLSFYEGLTLASIVVKEVSQPADQKTVASVFYNRLSVGMALGSDVTFDYALSLGQCAAGAYGDCDSAYNTRNANVVGLPPGPIANPNLNALMAVAEPTDSDYYYFVAGDDGTTHFSETADQHNAAVAQYCQELCQ